MDRSDIYIYEKFNNFKILKFTYSYVKSILKLLFKCIFAFILLMRLNILISIIYIIKTLRTMMDISKHNDNNNYRQCFILKLAYNIKMILYVIIVSHLCYFHIVIVLLSIFYIII